MLRAYQKRINFLKNFVDKRMWRKIYTEQNKRSLVDDVLIICSYMQKMKGKQLQRARALQARLYYAQDFYDEFYWDKMYKDDFSRADEARLAVICKFILLVCSRKSLLSLQKEVEDIRKSADSPKGKNYLVNDLFFRMVYGSGVMLEEEIVKLGEILDLNEELLQIIGQEGSEKKEADDIPTSSRSKLKLIKKS